MKFVVLFVDNFNVMKFDFNVMKIDFGDDFGVFVFEFEDMLIDFFEFIKVLFDFWVNWMVLLYFVQCLIWVVQLFIVGYVFYFDVSVYCDLVE